MIKEDNFRDANYLTISESGQCPFSRVQRTIKWGKRQEVLQDKEYGTGKEKCKWIGEKEVNIAPRVGLVFGIG